MKRNTGREPSALEQLKALNNLIADLLRPGHPMFAKFLTQDPANMPPAQRVAGRRVAGRRVAARATAATPSPREDAAPAAASRLFSRRSKKA